MKSFIQQWDEPQWGENKNLEGLILLSGAPGGGTPPSPPFRKNSHRPQQGELYIYRYIYKYIYIYIIYNDKNKTLLLKNVTLKVCQTSLFNLQKSYLSAIRPETKMLNGLIKLVFTPDELATSKATDKRQSRLKPLDQRKCSIVRGLHFISCSLYTCIKNMQVLSQNNGFYCVALHFCCFSPLSASKITDYYITACIVQSNNSYQGWLFS